MGRLQPKRLGELGANRRDGGGYRRHDLDCYSGRPQTSQRGYQLAVLTAASMRLRTAGAHARVRYIAAKIDAAHKYDAAPESLQTFAEYIRRTTVCSDEEQAKLISLPNRCAFRFAGSRDNLHAAAELLESLMSSTERLNSDRRKETFGMAALATSEAERQLKIAAAECQKASLAVTSPHDY
ncbi:hypothetical protein F01_200227 [Burkholderia cenocepacia]|nr:hypothetical protein F01_200227 [Burkholderia cenocepacia]